MADQTGGAATGSTAAAPAPLPPLPQRRPRVREVSSRFMSPLIQSNSTPIPTPNTFDFRRSKSAHRRQPSKTDENLIPEANRLSDKPFIAAVSTVHRKQHQQRVKQHILENGESKDHPHSDVRVSSRPDTPIAMGTERIVPSRYRQVHNSISRSNSLNSSSNGCSTATTAVRLLKEATSDDVQEQLSRISTSSSDDPDSCSTSASNQRSSSCPNSPPCMPVNKPDMRSSMPHVDKWLAERKFESSSKFTNDRARSLDFSSSGKMVAGSSISRPPHPPSSSIRSSLDVRKGRKVSNHQEDVHSIKMLSNHYLQWLYVNAKAEACLRTQKQEAERKFCSVGGKISDIRDNMIKKHSEFALFRGIKTLTTIVEAQMPYLDEWSTLEEDYSNSLSGTTNALLSSSVRLPVSADVRVDAGQLGEALNSALKVVELIGSHNRRFIQKAEEMDILISELARMVSEEKARTDECGYMLSKTCSSQVKECSLRGTLMQLQECNQHQPQKSETTA